MLKNGQTYRGFAIDLFQKIQTLLGTKFRYVYYDSWEELMSAGKRREIDIVFLAQKTEKRLSLYNFTDVVLVQHNKIISTIKKYSDTGVEDLYGKKVAVVRDSAIAEFIRSNFPSILLVESDSEPASLMMLLKGAADFTIAEPVRMSYYLNKNNIDGLYIAGDFPYEYKLRIASRNDLPVINIILNKALDNITTKERKSLALKWGYEKEVFFDKKLLLDILVVGTVIFIFLIYLSILNRRLKKARNALAGINATLEKRVRTEVEKNREKELIMLNQARLAQMGQVLNMIAHQWRQPLNSLTLINYGLILRFRKKGRLTEEDLENFREKTEHQIGQMTKTINDFRDFFKPKKEKSLFSLDSMLEHVINIIRPVYELSGIDLSVKRTEGIFIEGYENELAQAVLNILYNAKDAIDEHCPDGGSVTILLTREDGEAVLTVSDNGGGISEEIIGKIFDPYFSTKENKNGTGIGLYMSKLIIEQHMNGSLLVENSSHGAFFHIRFPEHASGETE